MVGPARGRRWPWDNEEKGRGTKRCVASDCWLSRSPCCRSSRPRPPVRLGVDGLFTNFPGLLAGLTVPNGGGPSLSLLATAGALAVYGPWRSSAGSSCAGAPRRARSRARVVLTTKHTGGDEPGLCIRGWCDLVYALL